VHRPFRPDQNYADRTDADTPAGRVFSRLSRLLEVRRSTPEFAGNDLVAFDAHVRSVVAFLRPGDGGFSVLVAANVADSAVEIEALTLSGLAPEALDLVTGSPVWLGAGVTLGAHGVRWLRVRTR
jgi:amylosucrase